MTGSFSASAALRTAAAVSSLVMLNAPTGNLGHATAAFTLDVYGHVSDRMKKESSSRMEEFIRSLTEPEDKTPGPIIKIVNG